MTEPVNAVTIIDSVEKMYEVFGQPMNEGWINNGFMRQTSGLIRIDAEMSPNPDFLRALTSMPKPCLRSIDDDWLS